MPHPDPDPWSSLRRHTSARIALGRAGGSLPTREVLSFSLAHAAARDAVHAELDVELLQQTLHTLGVKCLLFSSQASDRETYLQRPDLGRRLDEFSRAALADLPASSVDVALIIADGLSSPAAQRQAPLLLEHLIPRLTASQITIAPISIVRQARVAIEDEIGSALGATIAVILIGERPGLGTAHSLGAYLVHNPRPGRNDAERNCISNIRPDGMRREDAADLLAYLIRESLQRRISGVALKDERHAVATPHLKGPL